MNQVATQLKIPFYFKKKLSNFSKGKYESPEKFKESFSDWENCENLEPELYRHDDEISSEEIEELNFSLVKRDFKKGLVERLILVKGLKGEVYEAFKKEHINPKENFFGLPRGKNKVLEKIINGINGYPIENVYFSSDELKFKERLSNVFAYGIKGEANPLKRVNYGILSTGKLPKEFLNSLTNWEKVYLFKGRWKERNPEFSYDFVSFVLNHIVKGINSFEEEYSKIKKIKNPSLPFSKGILKAYNSHIGFS